jgi:rubredoxin
MEEGEMPEEKTCPRCGMISATRLACEYCGYRFQTEEGEVEIGLPGGAGRRSLRLRLGALLGAGGVLVLTMCICPQTWLVAGELADRALEIEAGFWSFGNITAAVVIACPVIYGVVLLAAGIFAWRQSRKANSPR